MCDCSHCSSVPSVVRYQRLRMPKNASRRISAYAMTPYARPKRDPPCGNSRREYQTYDAVAAMPRTKKIRRQRTPLRTTGNYAYGECKTQNPKLKMTHACRTTADLATEIALHGDGLLDVVRFFLEQRRHPREERLLRLLVNHEDVAVRTIAFAVAAADAVGLDVHLAARIAHDRVGRTVEHAERVLALPARIRREKVVKVDPGEREPRLPVRVNAFAGVDAVAASDAAMLVDEKRLRPHHHFFANEI